MSLSVLGYRPRWRLTELSESLLSSLARQGVERWLTEERYADDSYEPALLPLASETQACFIQLVLNTESGLSPNRVLDELVGSGLMEQCDDTGMLLLRRTAYRPWLGGSDLERRQDPKGVVHGGLLRRLGDRRFGT